MISAVVLSSDQSNNLRRCTDSLLWCDEIIIVQSLKFKVQSYNSKLKIYQRELNDDFSAQRNFGLEKACGEWVFFVDEDEEVTAELAAEIKFKIQNSKFKINGYYIKRNDFFLGRWLTYGEVGNIKLLRLARKGAGKWEGKVHEEWKVKGNTATLFNPLLHYPHPAVGEFVKEIDWYSMIRAKELFNKGVKTNFWQILIYPVAKFLQNFLLRQGFLDGMPGLIMALVMSFHSFLVRAKLYSLTKGQ